MKFVCDRCQTRYSIAEEKVRQKILRIRCKTCGNVIVVQDEHGGTSATASPATAGHPLREPARPIPTGAHKAAPSSGPKSAPSSGPKPPPSPAGSPASALRSRPGKTSDPLGGQAEWYVAIDGERTGPFARAELARRILAAGPGKAVHVWKDGMAGWKTPEEVSVVAREMSLLRPTPPAPPARRVERSASLPPPKAAPAHPSLGEFEALATVVAGEPDGFHDITTKKSKDFRDLASGQAGPGFAEVTTKKGKNLRDLESESGSTPQPTLPEGDLTPPPVRPLPPVGAKVQAPAPVAPRPPVPPFVAPAALRPPIPPIVAPTRSPEPAAAAFVMPGTPLASAPRLPLQAAVVTPPPFSVVSFDSGPPPSLSSDLPLSAGGPMGIFQRQPGLKYVVAAVAIVGLIILLGLVILRSEREKPVEPAEAAKHSEPAPPSSAEPAKANEPKPAPTEIPPPPPVAPLPVETKPTPGARSGGRHGSGKNVHAVAPAPERPVKEKPSAKPPRLAGGRPNPFDEAKTVSQSQITAVVRNTANQSALKSCYERALKMDNHLTSGRIDVTVSVGTSGAVQRVVINAPSSFILVEPCIKSAVKRWVFPPNTEEYGTNFPLIMQGGM